MSQCISKFIDFIALVRSRQFKKAEKLLKNISQIKKPNIPQLVLAGQAFLDNNQLKEEQSVTQARTLVKSGFTEEIVFKIILEIFRTWNQDSDYLAAYREYFPFGKTNLEFIHSYIYALLTLGHISEAKQISMSLPKINQNPTSYLYAGFCAYSNGIQTNNQFDFKLSARFFDHAKYAGEDVIKMHIRSLIKSGDINGAISILNAKQTPMTFKGNEISFRRIQMECIQDKNELGNAAAEFLRKINHDSLGEWQIVVFNHENPESVIQEIIDLHPIPRNHRGASIAALQLALKREDNEKFKTLFKEYTKESQLYVFQDLYPFFSGKNPKSLEIIKSIDVGEINDQRTKAYLSEQIPLYETTKYNFLVNVEHYLQQNDFNSALNLCLSSSFDDNAEVKMTLLRVAGLVGLTSMQTRIWKELSFGDIQYLSFASLICQEQFDSWDFESIEHYSSEIMAFSLMSLNDFQNSLAVAMGNFSFFTVLDIIQFRASIINNLTNYYGLISIMFCELVRAPSKILSQYQIGKIKTADQIKKLEERIDDSALPLYSSSESLKQLIYPSLFNLTLKLNACLLAMISIFNPPLKEEASKELKECGLVKLADYFDGKELERVCLSGLIEVSLAAMIAKARNDDPGKNLINETIIQVKNEQNERLDLLLRFSDLSDDVKVQKSHLLNSIDLLHDILK